MPWPGERRTEPYSEEELREMYRAGDAVSTIIFRAKRVNKWDRAKVREVLFGSSQ